MARSPTVTSAKPEAETVSEQVTYRPGPEDPVLTRWHGYVFHAHVPKTVTKALLIEQAKTHPLFKVGAFDPQRDMLSVVEKPAVQTSTQYRAHVIAWLKTCENAEHVIRQWAGDAALREACEVGTDDYDYLGKHIEIRLHELSRRDSLTEEQVGALWRRYGITQLPWASSNLY